MQSSGDAGASINMNMNDLQNQIKTLKHPEVIFFHLLFRTLAIITYLLCNFFSDNFVLNFIIIVLFLSLDFWMCKNVSGRLLVGLRWWNYVRADGTSRWVYEKRKDDRPVDTFESNIFWISLYVTPVIWLLFLITALAGLKITWIMIVFIALGFNLANLVGYNNCKNDAKDRVTGMLPSIVGSGLFTKGMTMFSSLSQSNSNRGQYGGVATSNI